MAKSIIFANTSVTNETRGRKTSAKTAKVRRAVLRAIEKAHNEDRTISTTEIVKATKAAKLNVIAALVWAERHDLVKAVGTVKHSGRGRPMKVWDI